MMLGLPDSTAFYQTIPAHKILSNLKASHYIHSVFEEQIDSIIWTHKISQHTAGIAPGKHFSEIEVIQINLHNEALDKRALSYIDKTIPYYVLYLQHYMSNYQIWLGDKTYGTRSNLKISNYFRTRWLDNHKEFVIPLNEKNIDSVYDGCIKEITKYKYKHSQQQDEFSADTFIDYCHSMLMTYSYKPLLILALIQNGGCMSVPGIANYFREYYTERKRKGLIVEKGSCIFAEDNASQTAMERNVIENPVKALTGSGFFRYESDSRLFYMIDDIYDDITLELIDKIEHVCKQRLVNYFSKISQSETE